MRKRDCRLPTVAFECNPAGEALALSTYWTELTGQPIAEALGLGWMKYLDSDGLSTTFTELGDATRRGEVVRFVVRCRQRNGEWCWLRTVARPRLKNGVVVGVRGLSIVADPMGEELPLRLEEAERLAARADALLSASPDLLFQVSAGGVYLGYRTADPSLLYVSPDRFLGKSFEDVLPPPLALQARQSLGAAQQTHQPQTFFYELPMESGPRVFEARVLPMKTSDLLFVIRDVTQARRNEEELVAAREEALERSRLKTQFLANVSH